MQVLDEYLVLLNKNATPLNLSVSYVTAEPPSTTRRRNETA
jgi:hypothetical protein